jgi:LemA protein
MRFRLFAVIALAASLLSGCGYNTFQTTDEQVKAAWSEVLNQYQRRADLVPNLVNTVKGYAAHEKGRADPGDRGPRQVSAAFRQRRS